MRATPPPPQMFVADRGFKFLLLMACDLGTSQHPADELWTEDASLITQAGREKLPSLTATHPQEGPSLLIGLKDDGHEQGNTRSFLSGDCNAANKLMRPRRETVALRNLARRPL